MGNLTFRGVVGFLSLFLAAGLLAGCPGDDDGDRTQEVADESGSVSGQIVQGDTQQPVEGLTVTVRSGDAQDTETDENGVFEIDGLAPTILTPATIGGANPTLPPPGGLIGSGHLVTISDNREVADDPTDVGEGEIASEADRLATKHYRVHIGQDIGGANQPFDVDMGIIAMNRQGTIIVQVNLEDGAAAPDGVTVAARPTAGTNPACSAPLQNINTVIGVVGVTTVAVPISATTVSGAATLNGLDECQDYVVTAPAQVINGTQYATASTVSGDLATVEDINGSTTIALVLFPTTLDEPLAAVSVNMSPSLAFQAALGSGPTRPSFPFTFGASSNVSNFGTIVLTNPQAEFTAPLTGDLVIVFNLPVTVDNDIALTFLNNLVDPDANDDLALDTGFNVNTTLSGVTGVVDASGTVLTISHTTALTANQIYTLQGTVRTVGSDFLNFLNTLNSTGTFTGNGTVYATDSSVAPLAANITADNLNGTTDGTGGAGQVFFQFREVVAGTHRVIATTTGTTTTQINSGNVAITPAGGTRLFSTAVDPAPVNACTICRTGDGTTFSFPIFGVNLNDNIAGTVNSVQVFVDVVDTEGNRLVDTLTLNIQ